METIWVGKEQTQRQRRGSIHCDMLPELRCYLEGILDEALAHAGMTIRDTQLREHVLCTLLKELDAIIFFRMCAALPPSQRTRFFSLVEQGVSEEDLQALTTRALPNLQAFAQGIFVDFRERYLV